MVSRCFGAIARQKTKWLVLSKKEINVTANLNSYASGCWHQQEIAPTTAVCTAVCVFPAVHFFGACGCSVSKPLRLYLPGGPFCDLVHVKPWRRQLGATTDQRCGLRQPEYRILRSGVAIANPSAVSTGKSMLDSARIVTFWSPSRLFRRSLAVHAGGRSDSQVHDEFRASLGISGIARYATDVTMRAESSILLSVETADGVAIAAPVRKIADSSCRSHLWYVAAPSRLLHGVTCARSQYGARQLWPVRLSPTRPQQIIDFEE